MNEHFDTKLGITIRSYAWPVSHKRNEATVFLALSCYPLDANVTMTPDEARHLAAMLIANADAAEAESIKEAA